MVTITKMNEALKALEEFEDSNPNTCKCMTVTEVREYLNMLLANGLASQETKIAVALTAWKNEKTMTVGRLLDSIERNLEKGFISSIAGLRMVSDHDDLCDRGLCVTNIKCSEDSSEVTLLVAEPANKRTVQITTLRDLVAVASDGDLDCELWFELGKSNSVFSDVPRVIPLGEAIIDSTHKEIHLRFNTRV